MFKKGKEAKSEADEKKSSVIQMGDFLRYGKRSEEKLGRLLGRELPLVRSVKRAVKDYNDYYDRSYCFMKCMYSSTERSISVFLMDEILKLGSINTDDKVYWAHKSLKLYVDLLHSLNKTSSHSLLPLLAKYICQCELSNTSSVNKAITHLDKYLDGTLERCEEKRSSVRTRTLSSSV